MAIQHSDNIWNRMVLRNHHEEMKPQKNSWVYPENPVERAGFTMNATMQFLLAKRSISKAATFVLVPSRCLTANAPEKLPKTNRKPDRLPFPPFFRGKLAVKLRGCRPIVSLRRETLKWWPWPNPPLVPHIRWGFSQPSLVSHSACSAQPSRPLVWKPFH